MITDKRLRELIELAEIAIVQYGEEHETMAGVKGSVRLSEDYQIYQELLTLREQNKEWRADAKTLYAFIVLNVNVAYTKTMRDAITKHKALVEKYG